MSLEKLLDFGKKYGSYSIKSVKHSLSFPFMVPTFFTNLREDRENNFIEKVIDSSATTLTFAGVLAAISSPPVAASLLLTNSFSFIHEYFELGRKRQEPSDRAGNERITPSQIGTTALAIALLPVILPVYLGIRSVEGIRKLPRHLAAHACSAAILGGISGIHYSLDQRVEENFVEDDVGAIVRECTLERNGKTNHFYLVGERHHYNFSSSKFAGELIDNKKPTVLLREGPVQTAGIEEPITEKLFFAGSESLVQGSGCTYQNFADISSERGIPVVGLERYSEEGFREGTSLGENVLLGALGAFMIYNYPRLYLASAISGHFPQGPLLSVPGSGDGPLLTKRNKIMVGRIVDYIDSHPGELPLATVGAFHEKGMLKLFADYGKFTYKDVPIREIMDE